jgi:hypothetical protein
MHTTRRKMEAEGQKTLPRLRKSVYVGCSGWRYWKWRKSFYANVPQPKWFQHYSKAFDTVEINASFYSWPTVANVQAWRRQPGNTKFVYTVKVCELITHVKKFRGTKTLIRDFGIIADILGERMGCFLFQLPPSYRYTKARLNTLELSFAPAAARGFPTSSSGQRRRSTYACTALSAGTGTIILSRNSSTGPTGSRQAVQRGPGFTSITIMRPMPPGTHSASIACSQGVPVERTATVQGGGRPHDSVASGS